MSDKQICKLGWTVYWTNVKFTQKLGFKLFSGESSQQIKHQRNQTDSVLYSLVTYFVLKFDARKCQLFAYSNQTFCWTDPLKI